MPFPVPEAQLAVLSLLQAWWFEQYRMCVGPILNFTWPPAVILIEPHCPCHGLSPSPAAWGEGQEETWGFSFSLEH